MTIFLLCYDYIEMNALNLFHGNHRKIKVLANLHYHECIKYNFSCAIVHTEFYLMLIKCVKPLTLA
jgi:hypothetical protein